MTVYVATWQHYENFQLLGVFVHVTDAIQECYDEVKRSTGYPGNEPITAFTKHPGGFWHGKVHPETDDIGYFVYEEVVK